MRVKRRLEGQDQLVKLVEGQAGKIQKLRGASLYIGKANTGYWWCLLSWEAQYTINRDNLTTISLDESSLVAAVAGMIGVTSSSVLRRHSRCTWRPREGARNVYNTAIRRALSPLRPYGSITADVHGCP
jgi:hypothetical protein